jgi:hypothetical protein
MKKLIFASLLALVPALAFADGNGSEATKEDLTYVTKKVDANSFRGLEVNSQFDVTLSKGSCQAEISFPSEMAEYVETRVSGDVLILGLKSGEASSRMMEKLRRKYGEDIHMTATVKMPYITSLNLSGVAKVSSDDSFDNGSREFKADISGASSMKNFKIKAHEVEFDISGAAKTVASIVADEMELDVSGAGTTDLDVDCGKLEADISGAAVTKVSGNADEFELIVSGAGKSNFYDLEAKRCIVDASGASKATVNATESLKVSSTGVSKVRYIAPDECSIRILPSSNGVSRVD